MKRTILVILLTVGAVVADESYVPPVYPNEIAEVLRPSLPKGWVCKGDNGALVISRIDQVTLLNPVSLPPKGLDANLRDFGRKTDYMIVLVFRPRLTEAQIAHLASLRSEALQKIENDSTLEGKNQYSHLLQERIRHFIPEYFNAKCSIYLHRTDWPPLEIYPKSVAEERDKIFGTLSKWLIKYEDHNK